MKILKSLILATLVTLLVSFFLGALVNSMGEPPPQHSEDGSWFYVNRGYPKAWAGVSIVTSPVNYPLMKLPLLTINIGNNTFVKIINIETYLSYFMPVFIVSFVASFFLFDKIISKVKRSEILLFGILIILSLLGYFVIFPQV